jgi:hypothetical protein
LDEVSDVVDKWLALNLSNISVECLLFRVSQATNRKCYYPRDDVIIGNEKIVDEKLET